MRLNHLVVTLKSEKTKFMSILQQFEANISGRDFVCGDIHGQWAQLQASLQTVEFNTQKDRLFALGDLIDRGEQSREVFTLLDEPWFFSIRGNHEQLMFDALENNLPQDIELWEQNGAKDWLASIDRIAQQEPALLALIDRQRETMPWAIELALADGRKVGLVHAEVPIPNWDLFTATIQQSGIQAAQLRYQSIWSRQIRDVGYDCPVANIDLCVHGHNMFQQPVRQFNRCFIDTGAFLTRKTHFGFKRERVGHLSLVEVKNLFALPESTIEMIKSLGWSRAKLK